MKKHFFIYLLLALTFFKANAQSYQYVPFPTESAIWSEVFWNDTSENKSSTQTIYEKFIINGEDTSINGKIYKKVYLFYDTVFNINTALYIGGIREENKKIYYIGDSVRRGKPFIFSNQETLLFDFSISIGDTLPTSQSTACNFDYPFQVTGIDTVMIGNKLRKVFKFYPPEVEWVEGIGSIEGQFTGLLCAVLPIPIKWSYGNNLICFKQNDTIVYFNNQFPECMPLNVPAKSAIIENIIISPNPATNYLTLKVDNFQLLPFTFQLYDMQGRLQLTGKTGNTQTEINVATLPRGLYVLKIITEKEIITKKVVLQ
jgi:hypothetical protein